MRSRGVARLILLMASNFIGVQGGVIEDEKSPVNGV